MPLLDHFRPPLVIDKPWQGFHATWAASIVHHLNSGILPEEYYAMPQLHVVGGVEVDVATVRSGEHQVGQRLTPHPSRH